MMQSAMFETQPRNIEKPRSVLREKFIRYGSAGLAESEALALLLTYATTKGDVESLANALIARFGSFSGVLNAAQGELRGVAGISETAASCIRLAKTLCEQYLNEQMVRKEVLSSPGAVVDFAKVTIGGLPREAFLVVYLNVKNYVIGHEVMWKGTVDRAIVYPREVIKAALDRNASGLILSHNHPSGNPDPSQEDKHLTRSIIDAAKLFEIRILDHIIVGNQGYFSFQENRLL